MCLGKRNLFPLNFFPVDALLKKCTAKVTINANSESNHGSQGDWITQNNCRVTFFGLQFFVTPLRINLENVTQSPFFFQKSAKKCPFGMGLRKKSYDIDLKGRSVLLQTAAFNCNLSTCIFLWVYFNYFVGTQGETPVCKPPIQPVPHDTGGCSESWLFLGAARRDFFLRFENFEYSSGRETPREREIF